MKTKTTRFEISKLSSKGQLVIPQHVRNHAGIKEGSAVAIAAYGDLIVMKKMNAHVTTEDLRTLRLVDEAWEDIENGHYRQLSSAELLEEMKEW